MAIGESCQYPPQTFKFITFCTHNADGVLVSYCFHCQRLHAYLFKNSAMKNSYILSEVCKTGADQGFLERGFVCIKVWGFALLNLSHLS